MSTRKPRVSPPRQARSLRTQQRLLDALEQLLETHEPEAITVDAICARAHASVGAFYKRFRSKRDLLPLLLERLQKQAQGQLAVALDESRWHGVGLAARVEAFVAMSTRSYLHRRRVIRACVAGRWSATVATQPADLERAREQMRTVHAWLLACRDEILQPEPQIAISAGLYLCLQSLQTAILFERLPPQLDAERMGREAARMLVAYLTAADRPQAAGRGRGRRTVATGDERRR